MNAAIALAIRNKRVVLTLMTLILLFGLWAYGAIVKEDQPDVSFPTFLIQMGHDGISPEDAEQMLIKPMEVELRSIEGLEELFAIGREGGAYIIAEFDPSVSLDRAKQDVREAVDGAKSKLPEDTLEPVLREFASSDQPVITVVLYGLVPEVTMTRVVRQAREALEAHPMILEANARGERQQMLEVIADPTKLTAYNIEPLKLLQLVQNNNRLVAAGSLDTEEGRFSVRVDGLVQTADDLVNLPVKTSGDGVITLGDIATVRRSFKEASSLARYGGYPAYTLNVVRRTEANVVETSEAAKTIISTLQQSWPSGVKVGFLFDKSKNVGDFLDTLRNNVTSAIVLVAVIVVAALGLRSALLVGVSVPGSFLFGILCLHFTGQSINNVVMFGLILSIGLLVDGAIVVSEYADRKMAEGLDKEDAYRLAAQRMAMPILSSTLTTVAAFLPLIFWPGVMGNFMAHIPVTVIYTLIGSFLMALIFLPTLGAAIGGKSQTDSDKMRALSHDAVFTLDSLGGATRWYAEILSAVCRHPLRVLGGTMVIMVLIFVAYVKADLGSRTFPKNDPPFVKLQIHARGNISIAEIDKMVDMIERRVVDVPGIEALWSNSFVVNESLRGAEDLVGEITLTLMDWYDRPPLEDVKEMLRARTADIAGIKLELAEADFGPIQGKDVQIRISAVDPAKIDPVVEAIKTKLASIKGAIEVEDTRSVPGIDWRIDVDRMEAGRFGTDVTTVGGFIQMMTNGILAGRYRPSDAIEEEDIRIRFGAENRGLQAFDELVIQTPRGGVPLSNLVTTYPSPKVGKITRIDTARSVNVNANVEAGVQANRVLAELKAWIAEQQFDPAVIIAFDGADRVQQEAISFLAVAMSLALALMGLILLAQFNSFYQTMLILVSVIMGAIGALFGLLVTGREFTVIMTGIGIVALAGIVVNNNIVLIDTYNRLVKEGADAMAAVVQTGAQRLRPVMLTTATTIIGLAPMALMFNIDIFNAAVEYGSPTSKFWVDLAVAVVFGLGVSTALTLVFTPAALALGARLKMRRKDKGKTYTAEPGKSPTLLEAAE